MSDKRERYLPAWADARGMYSFEHWDKYPKYQTVQRTKFPFLNTRYSILRLDKDGTVTTLGKELTKEEVDAMMLLLTDVNK